MKTNINYGYNEAHPTAPINKVGRKGQSTRKAIEKSEAIQLLKTGLTQKEVSERVGVTEKTLGKWAKECHHAQKIEADTLANLKNRLLALSIDKTTPIQDIVSLMLVIEQLENN
ncbi:helix-turn-helix domain-containing protein [Flavobacterium psychrophilum]|nr:helix-turn-helix domain-containing protein [Flavobacterium psychrophilum]